ncbi:hypothetical protein [Nocardia asteroides]|uniref:hypothetical protein n=1 Tax=Nocardia asteroides TaxID=1824 RepID=UPI001E57131F|nr:hypothetical protein [Nocardia asteroides]UGT57564.1 hypothetical protein LTT85_12295 [Nocardia asteroides]
MTALVERPGDLVRRVRQINEATDGACGRSYSADGTVFVEVNTLGSIKSIWLAEHAGENGLAALADAVVTTYEKAHKGALEEGQRIFDRMVRGDSLGVRK